MNSIETERFLLRPFCKDQIRKKQSEMTFGERVSAPGFQIYFESSRPIFQLKSNIGFQFPRPVFRRMWRASAIVFGETLSQVTCAADVTLIRMADAAQNVSIEHNQACYVVFGIGSNKNRIVRGHSSSFAKATEDTILPLRFARVCLACHP